MKQGCVCLKHKERLTISSGKQMAKCVQRLQRELEVKIMYCIYLSLTLQVPTSSGQSIKGHYYTNIQC